MHNLTWSICGGDQKSQRTKIPPPYNSSVVTQKQQAETTSVTQWSLDMLFSSIAN